MSDKFQHPPLQKKIPERVLQFGTGILLRGLPDFFIDKANKDGVFNGSVVMVKSTAGNAEDFSDGFMTFVRGVANGATVEEDFLNQSISRVILAKENWPDVLALASNPDINIIISNTTEVGLHFTPEAIQLNPPESFPGKLTAFLFERYQKVGDTIGETVVIPTELLPDNATVLQSIVRQLVEFNALGQDFQHWIKEKVIFCNSLVDRIVTKPAPGIDTTHSRTGVQTEPFRMWAIETGNRGADILRFSLADSGVICAPDITYYRERKLRMLNGCHTMMTAAGFLKGHDTVSQCMADPSFRAFTIKVLMSEIMPTVDGDERDRRRFAENVIERFSNPFLEHKLLSISFQSAMKMKVRNVPIMRRYNELFQKPPSEMCRGFAAWLVFMKAVKKEGDVFYGYFGREYPINDDSATYFFHLWQNPDVARVVHEACSNVALLGADLAVIPGFEESVLQHVFELLKRNGAD